jgi:hypothetical protein
MSRLVYLACPYSHPDPAVWENRFAAANYMAARLFEAGVLVFSPIGHSHPLAAHGLPGGWDYWRPWGEEFLRIAKAMVVLRLEGWEKSVGVAAEILFMREAGKPVHFVDPAGPIDDVVLDLWAI